MDIFFSVLFILIWGIFWGAATQKIITNKGYSETWFWWGFFFGFIALIIALTKPDAPTIYPSAASERVSQQYDQKMLENGGWKCRCGRVNPSYTGTCACGKTKRQALEEAQQQAKKAAESEEIAKLERLKPYKEFLDAGVITEEEYKAKRKEILG